MVRTDDEDGVRIDGQSRRGDVYRYDVSPGESVSEAVVAAVAAATDRRPFEPSTGGAGEALDPLYEVVNPDALDALFGPARVAGSVSFTYAGREVTVEGGEVVTVGAQ